MFAMNAVALSLLFLFLATAALWQRERLRVRELLSAQQAHLSALEHRLETTRDQERLRATAEERERIYADLHDDIGAKLLGLIHTSHNPRQADSARSILQDLRDVVSHARGAPGTLPEVLGEIRSESTQRMQAIGGNLLWTQAATLPDIELDASNALHLRRIVREAISNAVRHGAAGEIAIAIDHAESALSLTICDDGSGINGCTPQGRGTNNMRARAAHLRGTLQWIDRQPTGTQVLLSMPLEREPPHASP